jgi:hypothetical protein
MASIVGIASWCALHADQSDAILDSICSRLVDVTVNISTKVSLLNLIHEMMLSCAVDGCSEGGKKALGAAVAQRLPVALETLGPKEDLAELHDAVLKVTEWWSTLNIVPVIRLKAIRKPALKFKKSRGSTGGASSSAQDGSAQHVPQLLRNVLLLLTRYEGSKSRLVGLEGAEGTSEEDLQNARDDTKRRLRLLIRAIDGQRAVGGGAQDDAVKEEGEETNTGGGGLIQVLQGELDTLTASDPAETIDEKDDILGSFF